MKRIIFIFLFLCVLMPLPRKALGAVTAFLDKTEGSISDTFELTIEVAGDKVVEDPIVPPVNGLTVQASGKSQQVQLINGQMTRQVQFLFRLQPEIPGVFLIPEIAVQTSGGTIKTKPLQISVAKEDSTPGQSSAKGGQGELVFLESEVSKTECFVGELIVYRLKFFRRLPTTSAQLMKPSFSGFNVEDLEGQKDYERVVNGKHFEVSEIQFALFPMTPGVLSIEPAKVNFEMVDYNSRDPLSRFGMFSQGGRRRGSVQSNAPQIRVKPLPVENKPADFSGLIGFFQLESDIPSEPLSVGESLTLTFVLKGVGNVRQMPDLHVDDPLDLEKEFKVYDDKPKLNVRVSNEGIFGEKTFKKALVPKRPGTFRVPEFGVSYFDVEKMRYVTLRSPPATITVTAGASGQEGFDSADTLNPFSKRKVEVTGQDLMPVMKPSLVTQPGATITGSGIFVVSVVAPVLFFFGVFITQYRRKYRLDNQVFFDRKNALKIARDHAKSLEKNFSLEEVSRLVQAFFGRKFQLKAESLTPVDMIAVLKKNNFKEAAIRNFDRLMIQIEAVKFAPGTKQINEKEILEKTLSVLCELDKET